MPTHTSRPTGPRTLRGDLRRVGQRYGWRAYALPVLTVITVAALLHAFAGSAPHSTALARSATVQRAQPGSVIVEGNPGKKAYQAGATPKPEPIVIPATGDDAVPCVGNSYPQLVLVSISQQHLWACAGQREVSSTAVTTGETDNGDQTPLGSWRVQDKQRDRYLVGPGYRDYVQYWVPFNGDFGFHDASWQTMRFGSQQYTTQGSHGCVHLPTSAMSWFYSWVTVNQTVVTVRA